MSDAHFHDLISILIREITEADCTVPVDQVGQFLLPGSVMDGLRNVEVPIDPIVVFPAVLGIFSVTVNKERFLERPPSEVQ